MSFQCECGSMLKKITSSHLKTKKHQKWLSTQVNTPSVSTCERKECTTPTAVTPTPHQSPNYESNLVQKQAERVRSGIDMDEHCHMMSEEHATNYRKYKELSLKEKHRLRMAIPMEDRLPVAISVRGDKATKKKNASRLATYRKEMSKNHLKKKASESFDQYNDRLAKMEKSEKKKDMSSHIMDIQRRRKTLVE